MPIKFIRIDTDKLEEGDMDKILNIVNRNPQKDEKTLVGKRFLRALMFAAEEKTEKDKLKIALPPIKPFKETIAPETVETLKKITPPVPVKEGFSPEKPTVQREFKEVKYPLLVSQRGVLASALVKNEQDGMMYKVIEPEVDKKLVEYVFKKLRGKKELPEGLLTNLMNKAAKKFKQTYNDDLKHKIKYYVYRDLKNLGKIDPLIHDHNLTNITHNGKDKPLVLEHKTFGKLNTDIILTEKEVEHLIKKIAEMTKTKIDKKEHSINVSFMGFRFQGTLGHGKVESKFVMKKENL